MSDRSPRVDSDDGAPPAPRDHVDDVLERLRQHQARSGRHEVRQELGRGGMGLVLEVHDRDLLRPLAMKRLRAERRDEGDPERRRHFIARFLQEAQITGQLGHPGIPPVHELALDTDGEPFFTMPLIRGQTLESVLASAHAGRDGWSVPRALAVLLKVCEAMSFAHAKRIVHRDLKPANVMIGRFGEVYVMDWGLARVIGADRLDTVRWGPHGRLSTLITDRGRAAEHDDEPLETLDGDVLGTPYFMPPEQAVGDLEHVGPRSDIYAVGAMLYLLLTGRPPYAPANGHISPRTVLGLVIHGPPPAVAQIAPGTDPDLVAISEKAMARNAAHRYASMEALAADIESWLGHRPIRAGAPSLRHALRLFAERHRAAVATAAAGLLALFAAVSLFVWRVTQERDEKELARLEAQRRGDTMAAAALQSRAQELWPAVPAMEPAMKHWLAEVADLEGRTGLYRAERQALARDDPRCGEIDLLLEGTATLTRLRPAIEARLELAQDVQRISLDQHQTSWAAAAADIAGLSQYAGFSITPQLGLVPLGRNQESGLWEFWHVASGVRPATGVIRPEDGITLVLLPRARWEYGVPVPGAGKWQPGDQLSAVDIPELLCGKYEVTQAQWLRFMDSNPSRWQPAVTSIAPDCQLCPVESIAWTEAALFASRLDLELMPEYWWEYACQTSPDTPIFVHGPDEGSLRDCENVRDESLGSAATMPAAPWMDNYPQSAPVGSFRPNPFGLHDMLGNVAEWCADPVILGRIGAPGETAVVDVRTFRGGSWYQAPANSYSRLRQWDTARALNHARGVRVGRRIHVGGTARSDSARNG